MRASLGGGLIRDWEGKSWCMRVDRHVVGVSGAVCDPWLSRRKDWLCMHSILESNSEY